MNIVHFSKINLYNLIKRFITDEPLSAQIRHFQPTQRVSYLIYFYAINAWETFSNNFFLLQSVD